MKTSILLCCLQNKVLVVNCTLILIFLVNTLFFHAYRFGEKAREYQDIAGDSERNGKVKSHLRSSYIVTRQHAKRSRRKTYHRNSVTPEQFKGMSEKWIIVSLDHHNTPWGDINQSYLSFLDTVPGWTPVIVGGVADTNHGCKSCLTISTAPTTHQNPPDHHSQFFKAVATAIKHGARHIYVMTSLHNVTSALQRMTSSKMRGIIYSGKFPFKPCSHFVQPLLGSGRSFPHCHDSNWVYTYTIGEFPERRITGTCEDCGLNLPKSESKRTNDHGSLYCDPTTPNVAINPGAFVDGVFENSLWSYDAFWAMLFYGLNLNNATNTNTSSSSARDDALKFSMIIQRLLWEIRVSLSFVRSHDLNFRNISIFNETQNSKISKIHHQATKSVYNDILESKLCREKTLGSSASEIGGYLYPWTCNRTFTMDACVKELADSLHKSRVISDSQSKIIDEFIQILNETSYVYPDRSRGPAISVDSYIASKTKSLHFWPSSRHRQWSQSPFHSFCSRFTQPDNNSNNNNNSDKNININNNNNDNNDNDLNDNDNTHGNQENSTSFSTLPTLSGLSSSPSASGLSEDYNKNKSMNHNKSKRPAVTKPVNMVLVIVFKSNDPTNHIQMANFYDYMYGRHFKHIVYCTSGTEMIEMFAKMYPQPMTFIDLKVPNPKLYSYLCISEAMRMYHSSVNGYLHLDSETLLNPWTISNLHMHLDKPWINVGTMKTKLYEPEVKTANEHAARMWKDRIHGRRVMNSSIQDLLFVSRTIEKHIGNTINSTTTNQDIVQYLMKYNRIVKKFLSSFNATKLSQFEVSLGYSVIYYIPIQYRGPFVVLADEFSRYNVHSDIVVPTIIKNLDSNFLELNGTILSTHHTSSVLSTYRAQDVFLYPWEMHLLPAAKRSKFMCNVFLPQVEASLIND